jgi:hypothetical protein
VEDSAEKMVDKTSLSCYTFLEVCSKNTTL